MEKSSATEQDIGCHGGHCAQLLEQQKQAAQQGYAR
jgi:hypothetical protein